MFGFDVRRGLPALALLLALAAPGPGRAQEPDPTARLLHGRAVEAVIWSMPAISIKEFVEAGFQDYGATWNDVILFSKPAVPRHELLTANNQVPYMLVNMNLKNGPVVVEIPPATKKAVLMGSFCDNWFASIIDVGPAGADQGRGGKYLFLPPGYQGSVPSGYLVVKSAGYLISGGFRPVAMNGGTMEEAHTYAMRTRVYPLAQAANPKPTRFVDGYPKAFHSLPVYNETWFAELADFINKEPVRPRDKVMMGMLASLGIEKGKPFRPTPAQKKAMEGAVDEARQVMQHYFLNEALKPYWPQSGWTGPNPSVWGKGETNGWSFETANAVWPDQRAGGIFYWATYIPRKLGSGSFYLMGLRDSEGQLLKGDAHYKLRVPADVPVSQFWSAILYGMDTKAFVFSPSNRVGLSSYDKPKMQANGDGSVDLYFGPQAPAGLESNWIPTGGKDFFLIFRLYGPQKPLYSKTWKLPEIERLK